MLTVYRPIKKDNKSLLLICFVSFYFYTHEIRQNMMIYVIYIYNMMNVSGKVKKPSGL